jgi:phasin family protein
MLKHPRKTEPSPVAPVDDPPRALWPSRRILAAPAYCWRPGVAGRRLKSVSCQSIKLGDQIIVQCKKLLLIFFVRRIYIASRSQQIAQPRSEKRAKMLKGFEEFQKVGKDGFDAAVRSFGEVNKGFQAIAAEMTDYSKKAFEDSTRAFEQMIGAKSIEQAIEIQSQYAKKAYDTYMAEMTKLGEMYAGLAKDAYKPVEVAFSKKVA